MEIKQIVLLLTAAFPKLCFMDHMVC